jgi:hypothetical protein
MDQPNPAALTPPHNGTKETLQQLAWRRMAELGTHGSPLSIRQVWLRGGGEEPHTWSYETVRRVIELGRSNVSDKTVDRMALALGLPVSQVERAAQLRPRLVDSPCRNEPTGSRIASGRPCWPLLTRSSAQPIGAAVNRWRK